MAKFILVKDLKGKDLSDDDLEKKKPGWYRFYAKKNDIKKLLNSKHLPKTEKYTEVRDFYKDLFLANKSHFVKKEMSDGTYYGIYVGIAPGEALLDRINEHLCGTSNLGDSLSVLLTGKKGNTAEVRSFIDNLLIKYSTEPHYIGTVAGKKDISAKEDDMIEQHIHPLNIRKNLANRGKYPLLNEFIIRLNSGT